MQTIPAMDIQTKTSTCLHCGDSVPTGLERFCCTGCEFVYSLLNRRGLSDYYRIRDTKPKRVSESSESFAFCDDPEFINALSGDRRTLDFFLEGVDCTACVWLLEKLPEICPDADEARLRIGTSRLRVTKSEDGSFAEIARALDRLGYRPHPVPTETEATRAQLAADHQDLVRLGVAAFATGNIMLLAVSLYAGADGIWAERFRWISALLAAPVLTFSAMPFYRSAWAALRHGRLNIDVPIMLAVVVGIGVSLHGLWSGAETLYFDSLSMLVLLLLASRTWLKRLRRDHLDANDIDRQLLAGTVLKLNAATSTDGVGVSALSIRAGDIVAVAAGQFVPVDGIVLEGGRVQNAALTGESITERCITGDPVEAGAKVVSDRLVLRAETDFGKSRLSRILREAEQDARSKPRWIRFSDRVAQVFVIVVLLLAAVTFAVFVGSDPGEGARRALALVIVTCPCVFGMAIPLSLSIATKEAAQRGLIVKNADLFERLGKTRTVVFDKTGTLTEGDMRVTHAVGQDDREAVAAALALEAGQTHPVARAIREFLSNATTGAPNLSSSGVVSVATNIQRHSDGGLSGDVSGKRWRLIPFDPSRSDDNRLLSGARLVECGDPSQDERIRMELIVEDRLKSGAKETVRWFADRGIPVYILSGDHPSTVALCARQLELDSPNERAIARLQPEQKADFVRRLGPGTLVIGDGANDAPALATATSSIAVRGAMDTSLKVSDAYAMSAGVGSVPTIFDVARLARSAIRRNLAFSATFNVIAGTFAIVGAMTPLWAAIIMPMSSLTVLISALAARTRDEAGKANGQ